MSFNDIPMSLNDIPMSFNDIPMSLNGRSLLNTDLQQYILILSCLIFYSIQLGTLTAPMSLFYIFGHNINDSHYYYYYCYKRFTYKGRQ